MPVNSSFPNLNLTAALMPKKVPNAVKGPGLPLLPSSPETNAVLWLTIAISPVVILISSAV